VRSTKSEVGDATGEGSTGVVGVLATRFAGNIGVSSTGGEGVRAGDEGTGRA